MKQPLWYRLYEDPATKAVYQAVARMVGYNGISMQEASEKAHHLAGSKDPRFTHKAIQDAADELTGRKPGVKIERLELTPEARKACWQLLGFPPGHANYKPKPEERGAENGTGAHETGAGHAAKLKKPRGRSR